MPVAFAGFFLIARISQSGAIAWLVFVSLFFYGYWSLYSLLMLISSICLNYWLGRQLAKTAIKNRKALLFLAIAVNLLVLGYFKYANFFISNINTLRSYLDWEPFAYLNVILPIGISFFTFTQIAFLVDSYQEKVKERNFLHYILFVSFFPHLIAGPLLHHKQMMPQFSDPSVYKVNLNKLVLGLTIFTIGLGKKLLIADPIGGIADTIYDSVRGGLIPQLSLSWLGSVSYTFQLYFDFSGYSDMAVGLSLFFGILLPINFNAPLKATNIIDFWQRWHISLTKYIGEYLYTPVTLTLVRLGHGKSIAMETIYSLVIPTMLIFLILGLWHGPSWTYVIFGGMHGSLIIINHLWRKRRFWIYKTKNHLKGLFNFIGWGITFLSVNATFVIFRADSISTTIKIYEGMLGLNGIILPNSLMRYLGANQGLDLWQNLNISSVNALVLVSMSFGVILLLPSSATLTPPTKKEANNSRLLGSLLAPVIICLIFIASILQISETSPFLYFQF